MTLIQITHTGEHYRRGSCRNQSAYIIATWYVERKLLCRRLIPRYQMSGTLSRYLNPPYSLCNMRKVPALRQPAEPVRKSSLTGIKFTVSFAVRERSTYKTTSRKSGLPYLHYLSRKRRQTLHASAKAFHFRNILELSCPRGEFMPQ